MQSALPMQGIEPELLAPIPRRIKRPPRGRLVARLVVMIPLVLPLLGIVALLAWQLLLPLVGTPVGVRVVERTFDSQGFGALVAWPRKGWDGSEAEEHKRLRVTGGDYYRLTAGTVLPGLRLGRGRLQLLDVQTNGQPIDTFGLLASLLLLVPIAVAGATIGVGELARERWLLTRGRPVRGIVTARAKSGTRRPEYTIGYEYREMGQTGARLKGRATVTADQYEQNPVGQGVTVLHTLWNPRWHVAYSLLPARKRDADRR